MEDLLSSIPNDIILEIFSYLPTKHIDYFLGLKCKFSKMLDNYLKEEIIKNNMTLKLLLELPSSKEYIIELMKEDDRNFFKSIKDFRISKIKNTKIRNYRLDINLFDKMNIKSIDDRNNLLGEMTYYIVRRKNIPIFGGVKCYLCHRKFSYNDWDSFESNFISRKCCYYQTNDLPKLLSSLTWDSLYDDDEYDSVIKTDILDQMGRDNFICDFCVEEMIESGNIELVPNSTYYQNQALENFLNTMITNLYYPYPHNIIVDSLFLLFLNSKNESHFKFSVRNSKDL